MNEKKEFAALGFGEVMLRLSPPINQRIDQSDSFVKHAGGSELNVISGISDLGLRTGLISKLPSSVMGRYIRNQLRSYGVSDDYVLEDERPDARLGLYYYESGAYPRKPQVLYDRACSSFYNMAFDEIPEDIFTKTRLFHTSGITLALGKVPRKTAVSLIEKFRAQGVLISFDVNYRSSLWSEEEARATVEALLPFIDILFVSEETSRRMLGRTGNLEDIQKGYHKDFGVSVVASTQREIISPSAHNFNSVLYSAKENKHFTDRPYQNIQVVDRIGSGDAYVSGVLYSLLSSGDPEMAVQFGNAMAAIKNTIPGDMVSTNVKEVANIIKSHHATGYVNEMVR